MRSPDTQKTLRQACCLAWGQNWILDPGENLALETIEMAWCLNPWGQPCIGMGEEPVFKEPLEVVGAGRYQGVPGP